MAKITASKPSFAQIKKDLTKCIWQAFRKFSDYFEVDMPGEIDLRKYPISKDIQVYYEYAFDAYMPAGCSLENWGNEDGFKLLVHFIYANTSSASEALMEMVEQIDARATLDNGKKLSIKQIAVLAGMTEKSVRNAIHLEGENRLAGTTSENAEILVANHEAKTWLSGRRGFKETTYANFDDAQPKSLSHAEISKFVHDRLFRLYNEPGDNYVEVANQILGRDSGDERLGEIMVSTSAIHPQDCEPLANLLKVDAAWFTEQVMRALFPRQIELTCKSAMQRVPPKESDHDEEATS